METPNDLLFARAVVDAKLLTKKKVDPLLEEAEKKETPLSELLRNRKVLTPKQIRKALDEAFAALKEEDDALAKLAVEMGLADEESVQVARDEQKASFKSDKMLPARLGEILVSMESLTQEQLDELTAGSGGSTGKLIQQSGNGAGDVFELGAKATMGRFATHEIPLKDPNASRKHAKIEFFPRAKQHVLTDLGGANGTFVNDEKVKEPRPLVDGDTIRIGDTVFKYEAGEGVAPEIPSGDTRTMEAVKDAPKEETPAPEEPKEEPKAEEPSEEEKLASEETPAPDAEADAPGNEPTEDEKLAGEKTPADATPDPVALESERTEEMPAVSDPTPPPDAATDASGTRAAPDAAGGEKDEDAPAESKMDTIKRLVKNYPRDLKTSIRSLKTGLDDRKRLAAVSVERDRLLLKLGEAALEAKVSGPESDAVRKAEEKLDTLKKRRGKKPEASIRLAEEKRDFTLRKLGRYAVRTSLDLPGDEENIGEVRRLDATVKKLEGRNLTPAQIVLREKPVLVAAAAALFFAVLLVVLLSSGGPPPMPQPPAFAVVDTARDFNPVRPWSDLSPDEQAAVQEELPEPAWPEFLPADSDDNRILNTRARQLRNRFQNARSSVNATAWEDASLAQALKVLADSGDALQSVSVEKELSPTDPPHPHVAEYAAIQASLKGAVDARREVYVGRLAHLRLKKFAAAVGDLRKGNAQAALDHAWAFLTYEADEDLKVLRGAPLFAAFRERAKEAPAEVIEAARSLCRDLRFHAKPTNADLAILMYGATDFGRDKAVDGIGPGAWCAVEGVYTPSDTGDHLLNRGGNSFAVFETEAGLSGTEPATPMRIIGVFRGIEQFPTSEGGTTPCPILRECLVFKQE